MFIRLMSIDPGTSHLGVAILDLLLTDTVNVVFAETIDSAKLIKRLDYITEIHSERFAKIYAINKRIDKLLKLYTPHIVVSESPFINTRRPDAFAALVEVISAIRTTIFNHDPSVPFYNIDPSSVKRNMGVSGISGDKNLMKQALLNLDLYYDYVNPITLDEHSVDAICVGLCQIKYLNYIYK